VTALGIFIATFVTVFCLGFQSLNVNRGHYKAAALTSFMIGSSHLVLYKALPDGDTVACIAYLIAGPLAITASMAAHERWMYKNRK
jgi:hypothetical protein